MVRSFWTDSNAIKRKSKVIKTLLKNQIEGEKRMEKIQEKIDSIEWTEETKRERLRLYQEYERILEIYRMERIRIKWYKYEFL